MARKKEEPQEPSWGPESEMRFIDGLGTHRKSESRVDRSDRAWLMMYIVSHDQSPHSHQKAGVAYAQRKLESYDGRH